MNYASMHALHTRRRRLKRLTRYYRLIGLVIVLGITACLGVLYIVTTFI